jgi:Fe-S-cluster containining protein
MLVTDTGVPSRFIVEDEWGGRTMSRLEDGWCSALDRNSMMCSIYDKRPLICRDFEMGEYECVDCGGDFYRTCRDVFTVGCSVCHMTVCGDCQQWRIDRRTLCRRCARYRPEFYF